MPRTSQPRVVVITGASSGIDRATALAFARRGDIVVLAGRRAGMPEDAARDCEAAAGSALAVPTDVTEEAQVEALGRTALERFGRIAAAQKKLVPTLAGWFTGRALHTCFLAAGPSGDSPGTLFAPVQDGGGVDGAWRKSAGLGGAQLAAMSSLAALPLRLMNIGMTTALRLLEAMVPAACPDPASK